MKGRLELLFQLVKDGILTAKEAAGRFSVTEKEFIELMKKHSFE